jgi:hypothetical protein
MYSFALVNTANTTLTLALQTENLQTVAEFQLNQLTAASAGWAITPLNIDMDSL